MKKKLTLTVDAELIPRAKEMARSRGISLSQWVEDLLRESERNGEPSFSSRWAGRFVAAERADDRYDALARKYL